MTKKQTVSWLVGMVLLLVVASFFLSESFRNNVHCRSAIKKIKKESLQTAQQIQYLKKQLTRLKKGPETYELLVRRDLGYLRPGEKEIRFLKRGSSRE